MTRQPGREPADLAVPTARPRVRTGTLLAAGFLLTLLIAGVASFYASSHPDGLEFVAAETGILDQASDSPARHSPLAEYRTKGVREDRVSGGLAGAAGAATVAAFAGGLFWVIRRGSSRSGEIRRPRMRAEP
ncbi:MAG: PDGLE domain-containing protein [Nocardioides sp.]